MATKNKDYWARRMKRMEDAIKDGAYKDALTIEREYTRAIKEIDDKISAWYQRLADNNGVSFAEAQRLLTKDELEEFHWTVQEYIDRGSGVISGDWAKQLENASARVHISRLDALKLQLQQHAEELTGKRLNITKRAAETAFSESYYRTAYELQQLAGVGVTMQKVDTKRLEKVLSRPWTADGQTFTNRCWTDKNKLVDLIGKELTRMVATGAKPDNAIKNIAHAFETSKSNASRVVMTESAFFASAGQKDCFTELNVERFEVVGTFDSRMCDYCGEMNGKVFPMKDFKAGETAPPFHPWCRCTTAPYFEDMKDIGERWARDIETGKGYYVSSDMTFEEWKAMQDAKYGEGAVDNARKKAYNEKADREQYERYKTVLSDIAPSSYEEFQSLKQNNPDEWKILQKKYRIVNMYKVDFGDVTPKEILWLDDRVITEKRTKFTSKYKKSGNIAGAYLDGDKSKMYFAHSQISDSTKGYKGESELVLLKPERRFTYVDVRKDNGEVRKNTYEDTEAKLFEFFADIHEKQPFSNITMLSERGMCDSCKGVARQFSKMFPNVKLNVVSNKKVEGDVWKRRRRNNG